MEILFVIFLAGLGFTFYIATRWASFAYRNVLRVFAITIFLILSMMIFAEGFTATYAIPNAPTASSCVELSNCTNVHNSTCLSNSSCSYTYGNGAQLEVIEKDVYTGGVASLFLIFSLYLTVIVMNEYLQFKRQEDE